MEELGLSGESSSGVGELEGPQKVVGLLEVGSNSVNFIDKVSGTVDANSGESFLDNRVIGNGDSLVSDLSESTLVNKLLNGLPRGNSVCDVRLDQSEHTDGGLVQSHKGGVVELTKTEELHNLLGLGGNTDGTSNSDNKGKLGLSRDVESSLLLGLTAVVDGRLLFLGVFLIILLGVGGKSLGVGSSLGLGLLGSSSTGLRNLLLRGFLLENRFGGLHGELDTEQNVMRC